ncbi:Rpn family recombination-promoting nuclease/putative transposase [Phytoactinopolyspora endophytica]|uniref:Rpn family recombination-promoting nuclease/putative transposase n=1 Tax=Phytoactinopolyspora endophytica TaxID=1642495 RepID=UPI00101D674B|nr:Rpn family recombination-promoting nuclease/putative transposase [Phytoactinopolyspora endophytica]
MVTQTSPHDAEFRRFLGSRRTRRCSCAVLRAVWVDGLDLDRLAQVSGSFVDNTLRWRHADLLFKRRRT